MENRPTAQEIIKAVNDFIGFEVRNDTGKRLHCEPKQIQQYLINKVLGVKPPQISLYFGCNRSNVYNGIKKARSLMNYKDKQIQYMALFNQFGIDIMNLEP